MAETDRLTVFYDGACPLCRGQVAFWRRLDRAGRVAWVDISEDARPLLGTGFERGADAVGAEPTAVLSYGLWQELGGDRSMVGSMVRLDGMPRRIVGVMPKGFWFPDPAVRIWIPEPLTSESRSWNSTLVGRVAANHDVHAMEAPVAQLAAMFSGLRKQRRYSARASGSSAP